jgi:hypothetical protein
MTDRELELEDKINEMQTEIKRARAILVLMYQKYGFMDKELTEEQLALISASSDEIGILFSTSIYHIHEALKIAKGGVNDGE